MTIKEIKAANPKGKFSYDTVNNATVIVFDNGVILTPAKNKANTLWNKLLKMGFERHYNFSSDDNAGIVQAANNGENPFAFSIICSNSMLNEVCK